MKMLDFQNIVKCMHDFMITIGTKNASKLAMSLTSYPPHLTECHVARRAMSHSIRLLRNTWTRHSWFSWTGQHLPCLWNLLPCPKLLESDINSKIISYKVKHISWPISAIYTTLYLTSKQERRPLDDGHNTWWIWHKKKILLPGHLIEYKLLLFV